MSKNYREQPRIPKAPYPGLRPFRSYESMIFYGRERQITQLVRKIEKNKIVTILGGSGSGKSSLVKAGVIPELRKCGIEDAGHFWIPVVFTPGTDFQGKGSGPYHNLVREFVSKLDREKLVGFREEIKNKREKEVGQFFSSDLQENSGNDDSVDIVSWTTKRLIALIDDAPDGLRDMVDQYSKYLAAEESMDTQTANFLFVFDQFEEVFHRSNEENPNAKKIVSTFIESLLLGHFKRPHDKIYIVITMRSEHLNDCTRYLNLPDLINNTTYLLGRLMTHEISEIICRPLKRYLRLLKRTSSKATKLPNDIEVAPALIERMVKETKKLEKNPDHLPLLQHLLFRLWKISRKGLYDESYRDEANILTITEHHLQEAVSGGSKVNRSNKNILITCLDSSAELRYDILVNNKEANKEILKQFFLCLAYKDDRGFYNQSRIDREHLTVRRDGITNQKTITNIVEVFSEPYCYLQSEGALIKVSHESFIRGWERFKDWIDEENNYIKKYKRLLLRYDDWKSGKRSLLDEEELALYQAGGFAETLQDDFSCNQIREKIKKASTSEIKKASTSEEGSGELKHIDESMNEFITESERANRKEKRDKLAQENEDFKKSYRQKVGIISGLFFLVFVTSFTSYFIWRLND